MHVCLKKTDIERKEVNHMSIYLCLSPQVETDTGREANYQSVWLSPELQFVWVEARYEAFETRVRLSLLFYVVVRHWKEPVWRYLKITLVGWSLSIYIGYGIPRKGFRSLKNIASQIVFVLSCFVNALKGSSKISDDHFSLVISLILYWLRYGKIFGNDDRSLLFHIGWSVERKRWDL